MIGNTNEGTSSKRLSGGKLFLVIFFSVVLALVAGAWLIKAYIFPSALKPVELSQKEQVKLNSKLQLLGYSVDTISENGGALEPQAYSEKNAKHEVIFSEKEINSLIGKNTNLAQKMAIDFSDGLASARIVFPVDPDFPILGGKTIRANAGVSISYKDGKPSIILKGLSLWGVGVPNAWLGNLKNVDLIQEFGDSAGFWQAFADGVEFVEVKDGELHIKLKE